jgi:hypothetical protein
LLRYGENMRAKHATVFQDVRDFPDLSTLPKRRRRGAGVEEEAEATEEPEEEAVVANLYDPKKPMTREEYGDLGRWYVQGGEESWQKKEEESVRVEEDETEED